MADRALRRSGAPSERSRRPAARRAPRGVRRPRRARRRGTAARRPAARAHARCDRRRRHPHGRGGAAALRVLCRQRQRADASRRRERRADPGPVRPERRAPLRAVGRARRRGAHAGELFRPGGAAAGRSDRGPPVDGDAGRRAGRGGGARPRPAGRSRAGASRGKPLKILQAMAGAPHGGAEAFFDRLVSALARANIEQRVLTRDHPERLERLRAAGLDPVALRFGGLFDRRTRRAFGEAIRAFAPDIVLTWMSRATAFCPRASALDTRFVHVARLGGYYDPKYFRACDHLIGNTPDIRDWLIAQKFAPERVHYLPNFVAAVPQPAVARASLDTPDDAPLVLGLGRLHENKAWDVLLEAVACLPAAYLWIAGEGLEGPALERRAARLGLGARVRWLGWRGDVPALLAAA